MALWAAIEDPDTAADLTSVLAIVGSVRITSYNVCYTKLLRPMILVFGIMWFFLIRPQQKSLRGILSDIAWRVREAGMGPPAVVIIGRNNFV